MDDEAHIRSTAGADAMLESAVLQYVLSLYPARAGFDELLRELGEDEGFAGRDAVERAVRGLAAAGLIRPDGAVVEPTRAALRFDELLGG